MITPILINPILLKNQLNRVIFRGLFALFVLHYITYRKEFNVTRFTISSAIFIVAYIGLIYYRLSNTKKTPQTRGIILGYKEYEFTNDEIICKTEDSVTNLKWNSTQKIEQSKTAFYLYVDTNMALIIPKRYFETEAQQQDFSSFVTTKITTTRVN